MGVWRSRVQLHQGLAYYLRVRGGNPDDAVRCVKKLVEAQLPAMDVKEYYAYAETGELNCQQDVDPEVRTV
jgi:hypothetical protein